MRKGTQENGAPYIEWQQAENGFKKAWIQIREGDKDWAGTRRYLNVVRSDGEGRGMGNATDFPIASNLSDDEILEAFVRSTCAIVGCKLGK